MGTMSITEVGVYTVEDLYAFREQRGDVTVQLIEGELIVSPGPSVQHQDVLVELLVILRSAVPEDLKVVPAPLDLRAGERTVIQPDLMVIPRSLRSGSEVGIPPVLAVEILSPSSRRTDLVLKPEALARSGCQHYWVVDPRLPAIRVFRLVDGVLVTDQVVEGEALLSTAVPFAVDLRPADLVVS